MATNMSEAFHQGESLSFSILTSSTVDCLSANGSYRLLHSPRKNEEPDVSCEGSGSLEQDSPLGIVAMKKEKQAGFMHDLGLGKG
jgi:hypothetical protein